MTVGGSGKAWHTWCRILALGIGMACLCALLDFRVPALAYHWISDSAVRIQSPGANSQLSAYCADIQAQPVPGVDRNLSGLTYNRETGTLFAVINRPAAIVELSVEGQTLSRWALEGPVDPEGITHVTGKSFVVVDEKENRLYQVNVPLTGASVLTAQALTPSRQLSTIRNLGMEGVSWDQRRGQLVVVQEKWPQRVIRYTGMQASQLELLPGASRSDWEPRGWHGLVTGDLSSVTVNEATSHWLMLSASSALVALYDEAGKLLDVMPLWQGHHGLKKKIPQGEGIATDLNGRIFVVSEPNLFYRFSRRASCE